VASTSPISHHVKIDRQFVVPVRPRIPEDLVRIVGLDETIQLRGAEQAVTVQGSRLVVHVLDLLDGTRTAADVVDVLIPMWQRAASASGLTSSERQLLDARASIAEKVDDLITQLYLHGVLEDEAARVDNDARPLDDRFSQQMRVFSRYLDVTRASRHRSEVQETLRRAHVLLFCHGMVGSLVAECICEIGVGHLTVAQIGAEVVDPALVRNALCETTIASISTADAPDIVTLCESRCPTLAVFASARPFPLFSEALNRALLTERIPLCSGLVDGRTGLVGPTVIPGETGCYACYLSRRRAASQTYAEDRAYEEYLACIGDASGYMSEHVLFSSLVANALGLEILRLLTFVARPATYPNRIIEHDMLTGEAASSQFFRLPECPACGTPKLDAPITTWH
jgi:bacteriocin biosynthesis cyclodehydratase domain-containing protein